MTIIKVDVLSLKLMVSLEGHKVEEMDTIADLLS